jgi:hypothetical protein
MRAALMWTINDFSAYRMVFGWSTHGKLACPYYMENNNAFMLTNGDKAFFFLLSSLFLAPESRVQKEKKMIFLLAELKSMLHPHVFLVKNCMMLYQSTVTLCFVSNQVSRSFLVLV